MDENERKRKRDAGEDEDTEIAGFEAKEAPLEGLKRPQTNKKQKIEEKSTTVEPGGGHGEGGQKLTEAEKRKEKRARQAEKRRTEKEKEKVQAKKRKEKLKPLIKAAKEAKKSQNIQSGEEQTEGQQDIEVAGIDEVQNQDVTMADQATPASTVAVQKVKKVKKVIKDLDNENIQSEVLTDLNDDNDADTTLVRDIKPVVNGYHPSPDASPTPDSTFSPALEQVANSSSSSLDDTQVKTKAGITAQPILQSTHQDEAKKAQESEFKESKEVLRARLEAKIKQLKEARKAINAQGEPIRTRAELIEQRRETEIKRKAKKKKQREAADAKVLAEAVSRSAAGSPSINGSRAGSIFSPIVPAATLPTVPKPSLEGISYSRVAFVDGDEMRSTSGVSKPRESSKLDPKSALAKAEARAARLAALDPERRADIEAKELWTRARQRISGEKPKDDVSLLKKTLKRREKQKAKSEKAWEERKDNVIKGQEIRQKKREANLQKRKDEKGGKKAKKVGGKLSDKQKMKNAKRKAF